MSKKKSGKELVRFVWSRKIDYDLFLLLEVQERNPFSFKKSKPVWVEIAESLRKSELKMRVTNRSCRERDGELLKKHRKDEVAIIRSTGATHDKITELKKLLIVVNEMSVTKPSDTESSVYKKANKRKGESLREAALNEVSDTDSDNYIDDSHKKSRSHSSRFCSDDEVTNFRDYFNDDDMTLEEERVMDNESLIHAESLELEHSQSDESWKDIPSSSRDNRHFVPVPVPSINVDNVDAEPTENESHSTSSPLMSISAMNKNNQSTSRSLMPTSTVDKDGPTSDNKPTSNSRFSNPKKDLINYLEKKAVNELGLRKEEVNIRKMELEHKKEELDILRFKTESEAAEKKRSLEIEAENKKEELQILRLKTEAEIEERKRNQ